MMIWPIFWCTQQMTIISFGHQIMLPESFCIKRSTGISSVRVRNVNTSDDKAIYMWLDLIFFSILLIVEHKPSGLK